MTWTVIDGKRVIVETLPGSPAEAAGIQPGWIAETRDGKPLNETTQYVARLNHPITFGFRDLQDRPVTLQLSPQLLRFDRLVARQLEGGVRYLRFDRFSVQSLRWLSQQLKEHRPAPAAIVDLRRNPGGTLFAALATVEEFFDHSVPAGEFVRRDGRTRATKGISLFSAKYPGRVIVLIGPGSASSSEIVAHVLQQQKRATIIGQRSAGAVIASEFFSLPGGGRLQVPIQDYIGVDGRRLEGRGVTPDIVTPRPTVAEIRAGRDLEIEAALTELRKEALIGRN
jgi:carboxyl-terminal processing protease